MGNIREKREEGDDDRWPVTDIGDTRYCYSISGRWRQMQRDEYLSFGKVVEDHEANT